MNCLQWILFLCAWLISTFAHAQNSVVSASNGLSSFGHWFKYNLKSVLLNLVITVGLGLVWKEVPHYFEVIIAAFPITYGTSILAGVAIQNGLDRGLFLAGLRVEMPKLVPPQ
jgi:hypothetical protein